MDSFLKVPLESTHHSLETAAGLPPCLDPDHFFFSFNLSPVYYLYPNYGSLWDVLGPFPFSVSMDRTVGYKIDQVFQSFLMWQCASEFPVMIYFSQTKNIPSNKIWKHPWGPGQGICALWTHWEEKWADTFPVPTSYLQTRIIVMW